MVPGKDLIWPYTALLNKILDNSPLQIYGDGSSFRDYTYIDDVLQGINNAINRLKGFNIYNIGESRKVLLSEVIETIENALGKKAIKETRHFRPGMSMRHSLTSARPGRNWIIIPHSTSGKVLQNLSGGNLLKT